MMFVDRTVAMLMIVSLALVPAFAELHEDSTYFPYEGVQEELIERTEPREPMGSAHGSVFYRGDGESQDVYVELGASGDDAYTLEAEEPIQGPVTIDVPVNWTQTISVSASEEVSINLWNHEEQIPRTLLSDAIELRVMNGDDPLSEVPIFRVANGTWNLTITYTTPAVHREVRCEENTVADLLPSGAQLISSDLPLDTFVQRVCRIRLYHESYTPYTGVSFTVSEIDQEDVVSVYSVEQQRYLFVRNNTLIVPRE